MKRKSLDWNRFWSLDEIYGWFDDLIDNRPTDLSLFHVGTSYEGREIKGLKINVGNVPGKGSIFLEATIHGDEWLGATTSTFIINELLTDPSLSSILNRFEWYFLPILNVDGFSYAWNVERTWRKTRRPSVNSLLCIGSDPNRNSDVAWNVSRSSSAPCHQNYPGDFAFSEPEVYQFSEFMKTVPNLDIYFNFHCYGQFFMFPSGISETPIETYQLHHEIGEIANAAIFNKTGTPYELGPITEFFGLISGTTTDWVWVNLQPKLSFMWELRPKWESLESYAISPELIKPVTDDMHAAFFTVIDEAIKRGVI